ncbi:hypothetical protein ACFP1Z_03720 [Streptomyces gamaensis]|uniref:Uncharacterized protein n=1 Tax=Streptomyces gamaensis TaxID=1763542 RepID=A0ABW0YRW5_9ACTN
MTTYDESFDERRPEPPRCEECHRIYDGYIAAALKGDGEEGLKWKTARSRHLWLEHA